MCRLVGLARCPALSCSSAETREVDRTAADQTQPGSRPSSVIAGAQNGACARLLRRTTPRDTAVAGGGVSLCPAQAPPLLCSGRASEYDATYYRPFPCRPPSSPSSQHTTTTCPFQADWPPITQRCCAAPHLVAITTTRAHLRLAHARSLSHSQSRTSVTPPPTFHLLLRRALADPNNLASTSARPVGTAAQLCRVRRACLAPLADSAARGVSLPAGPLSSGFGLPCPSVLKVEGGSLAGRPCVCAAAAELAMGNVVAPCAPLAACEPEAYTRDRQPLQPGAATTRHQPRQVRRSWGCGR